MSFRDCITSAMADGHISREAGDEYIARYDKFVEDGVGRLPFHESQARAAQRLQGEIERKIQRKKRKKVKQALAIDRIKQRLTPGQVEKAADAVLDFDPKLEHVGDNITMRHESTRGTAFALMSDFRFRSKHGGLTCETAGMDDVVAGFFGGSMHRAWHTPSLVSLRRAALRDSSLNTPPRVRACTGRQCQVITLSVQLEHVVMRLLNVANLVL